MARRLDTEVIHFQGSEDPSTGSVNVPIYQTATYRQEEIGVTPKWEYSRTGNPTRAALEAQIAGLEGGDRGFAFSSGMAAITTVLSLFEKGDRILLSDSVYGGTYRVLDKVFSHFGIEAAYVEKSDPSAWEAAFTKNTKAVLLESPANPILSVTDIAAVSGIAHGHGARVIVDNTFLTPYLQQPLDLGADIVVHSATKYLGGHSDVVAGLVVTKDPADSERIAFLQNSIGAVLPPFDSFLLIRGIKTLAVRMDRHTENALSLARFLREREEVEAVHYPGLKEDPGYALQKKQAVNGGAMIAFTLQPSRDVKKFFAAAKGEIIALAESLGGVETLVCHPSGMTHAAIPEAIRKRVGISENLIRLSVGIENIADLKEALSRMLAAT
ncbi:MAG: PLP-dependent transferase [Lachnospiraceae bacterium]|nr:PLP-dependent transferase [Lachnospiraceae bacterium]